MANNVNMYKFEVIEGILRLFTSKQKKKLLIWLKK